MHEDCERILGSPCARDSTGLAHLADREQDIQKEAQGSRSSSAGQAGISTTAQRGAVYQRRPPGRR